MVAAVLQNKVQIQEARAELHRRKLSAIEGTFQAWLRRAGFKHGPHIGDYLKSWDVLETLRFIEEHIPPTAAILDMGAYASEVLVSLHRAGYSNLHGADLNPALLGMPHTGNIKYCVTDFRNTPFADQSMSAVTAISVIEHGFDGPKLLDEVARLLAPGGYFIASFDYWPDKIETAGQKFFDMDWLIFSQEEVLRFCDDARARGLRAVGALSLEAKEPAIECAGQAYTFAWLAVQRAAEGTTLK